MSMMSFHCLAGNCEREIYAGLFCGEHAYLNDSPQALWAVRQLDEHARELRGVYCAADRWGFRADVSRA